MLCTFSLVAGSRGCSLVAVRGLPVAVGTAALRNSLIIDRLSVTVFVRSPDAFPCDLVLKSDSLDVFRDLIDEKCGKEPGEFTSTAVRKGLCPCFPKLLRIHRQLFMVLSPHCGQYVFELPLVIFLSEVG